MFIRVIISDFFHSLNQLWTMPVKGNNISLMCRELITHKNFSATGFIKHRRCNSISKSGNSVHVHQSNILYKRMISNYIISYIVMYFFYAAIVTDSYIVQCGIFKLTMFLYSTRQGERILHNSQVNCAGKLHAAHILCRKAFSYINITPILRSAELFLQPENFISG